MSSRVTRPGARERDMKNRCGFSGLRMVMCPKESTSFKYAITRFAMASSEIASLAFKGRLRALKLTQNFCVESQKEKQFCHSEARFSRRKLSLFSRRTGFQPVGFRHSTAAEGDRLEACPTKEIPHSARNDNK